MNGTDSLRNLLAEASDSAPSDHGLLAAVRVRAARRQRHRQAMLAATVAVAGIAGFGGVKALGHSSGAVRPDTSPSPSASSSPSCPAGSVPAMTALVPESAITVKVYNGSKVTGANQSVGEQLAHRGFTVRPMAATDVKPRTPVIAEISYGPKAVGAAQVVRAYFGLTTRSTDIAMHFDINETSDVVVVTIGDAFRIIVAPTEVHLAIAQLGRPAAPPGTCAAGTPAPPAALPLSDYTWPTFPYTPGGQQQYRIDYDEQGLPGLGVTGSMLAGDFQGAYGVIFVSTGKPQVPGSSGSVTVGGRKATVVARTLVPLYKDDGSKGTVIYWNDGRGRWVSLIFGPSTSVADATYAARHLSATPVSVLSTFVPTKIPAGMRVAVAHPGLVVLRSDDAAVADITITAENGEVPSDSTYRVGDSTYDRPFDAHGHVQIVAGPGSESIDLAAFAAQITIVPGDVSALTGGG